MIVERFDAKITVLYLAEVEPNLTKYRVIQHTECDLENLVTLDMHEVQRSRLERHEVGDIENGPAMSVGWSPWETLEEGLGFEDPETLVERCRKELLEGVAGW